MLKRAEIVTLLTYIAGAFPGRLKFPSGTTADDAMITAYKRALSKFPSETVMAAADKFISSGSEWPPSAGQLAVEAEKLATQETEITGIEAWEWVLRAFEAYSPFYNYYEFMNFLPERVREVVRLIGIDTIDRAEPSFMQHRFCTVFEQQKNISRDRRLAEEIRNKLSGQDIPKLNQ